MRERFVIRLREIFERSATLTRSHPKVVLGLILASISILYLLLKIFGGTDRVIYKVDNLGTFTERRIFNQGSGGVGTSGIDGRDRIVSKTLAEIGGDIKIIYIVVENSLNIFISSQSICCVPRISIICCN